MIKQLLLSLWVVRIGACTDCRNDWAKFRAGTIDIEDFAAVNEELAPTVSTLTWTRLMSRAQIV